MKKLILLAFLGGCATHTDIIFKATDLVGYRDLNYWVRYGNNVMIMPEAALSREREIAQQKQASGDWVARFEYAIFIGLRSRGEKDYKKSISHLEKISRRQDLDEESILAIQWYLLHIKERKQLFDYGNKHKQMSVELNKKLRALSTIEKKIQKRSEQVVR